ncbi:MAG: hypothetical protein BGO68_06025 [Candidatus Amoebophilus sp. 36-38]|nr:MAG: hypothetical protein BGO68_06025 [Candidatus Amoebophilus sp. 36-38]
MNIEDKKQSLLFKRGGTCQEERLLPTLLQNNKLIDSKDLDEYIVFTYLYTDLLKFYETQNEPITYNAWRNFLEYDDTTIYSLILHTQINKLRGPISNYSLGLKRIKNLEVDNKYLKSLLSILEELLVLLSYWYENLSEDNTIRLEIYNLISYELNDNITFLYNLLKQERSNGIINTDVTFFEFIESLWDQYDAWERNVKPLDESLDSMAMHEQLQNTLNDLFESIFNGMSNLQRLAQEGYGATLISQQHKPQAALIIVFLRLLEYATAHLNYIPQRHLDYYYREVLKFNEEPLKPDKIYVHFHLKENRKNFLLAKGVQLVAGKDETGEDIIFETDKTITINQAKIDRIHTFNLKTQTYDSDDSYPKINLDVASYDPEALYAQKVNLNLFTTDSPAQNTTLGPIGFLIASPVLYLKEGKREIKLGFKFDKNTFETLIKTVKQAPNDKPDEIYDKFATSFNETITVQLTTEEGWTTVAQSAINTTVKSEETYVELTLTLMPDVPSIIKFNSTIHGNLDNLESPTIRILLQPESYLAYIFMFRDITIEKLSMYVNVTDYRGLILQNDLGLIDTSKPFEPFGPFPKLHANFYIGSDEIFYKKLAKFKINITWVGLPTIDNGFQKYYEAYPGKITNQDFQVNISYLKHRQWNPFYPEHRQKVALFDVEKKLANTVEILKENRTIDEIDFDKLGLLPQVYNINPPLWTSKTLTGFLKLEIDGPDMAFGHTIYPTVMAQTNLLKEKNKNKKNIVLPTLNEPYTPQIKSLSVDYSAEDEIDLKKADELATRAAGRRYIQLMPFGYKVEFPNTGTKSISSSPSTNINGDLGECFFTLGIQDLNGSILRLHIQLDEGSIDPDKEFAKPTWCYLSDNNWVHFKENEIIADETMGLTKPGIIVLVIPAAASTNNTLMGTGLVWLKISFPSNCHSLPKILGIYTQAASAIRKIDLTKDIKQQPTKLPSYSIQNILGSPIAIESVTQPFPSFGGKPAETQIKLYTRISERLRHKNRAISPWDYERIALDRFPEIFRVKCINHSQKIKPFLPQPGKITLVIIPSIKGGNLTNNLLPQASKQLLESVKQELQKVVSPFVTIDVINPTYEEVKVNLEVKFKKGYEKGVYSNELQRSIRIFLSPWLFNQSEDIRLGATIPSSKIMDFISKRYYVEAIGNFSILKYTGSNITKITDYDNQLMSTYPWSVMISSDNHRITVVDDIDPNSNFRYGGVDDMSIEDDFIIGPWLSTPEKNWIDEVQEEIIQESLEEYYLVTKKYIKH